MKYPQTGPLKVASVVVPLAGTWIEIEAFAIMGLTLFAVVPLAGTWIEISGAISYTQAVKESFPLRGRGLK